MKTEERDKIYLKAVTRALSRLPGLQSSLERIVPAIDDNTAQLLDEAEALSMGHLSQFADFGQPGERPLLSLLNRIKGNDSAPDFYHLPVTLSTSNQSFFPCKDAKNCSIASIIEALSTLIAKMVPGDDAVVADNLLDMLYTHGTSISSSKVTPDVSWYDQAHMMAAIAVCLQAVKEQGAIDEEHPFLLVGGDFSGIQPYIYQIVSKYAGKNLKGRSFYVKLLGDAVVSALVDALSLQSANVIYNSGGSFYLLAPNTKETIQALNSTVKVIEEELYAVHGTAIYVAIDSVALSKVELTGKGLQQRWINLFEKRDSRKTHKWASIMQESYSRFFEPTPITSDLSDAITGLPFLQGEKPGGKIDGKEISAINKAQIDLGKALRNNCRCIVATKRSLPGWDDITHIEPAGLGIIYYIVSKDGFGKIDIGDADILGRDATIMMVNEPSLFYGKCCSRRTFYGGNDFNYETLDRMCENEGFSRMGVLRMDVDNLGSIFQSGIEADRASMARYAALSRSFDLFFTGYINTICKSESEKAYIIYAGGDDLFIVGEWRAVIRIAEQIHKDFKVYTCSNPAFSISGGIAILGSKYPIIAGAKESADGEDSAKGHEIKCISKNAITIMGMPLNWDKEYPAVVKLKDELVALLEQKLLNKSFLSKVMLHASNAGISDNRITKVNTYWMVCYDMKRFKEKAKIEVKQLVDNFVNEVCQDMPILNGMPIETCYHKLELWFLACRWAELEYRSNNGE